MRLNCVTRGHRMHQRHASKSKTVCLIIEKHAAINLQKYITSKQFIIKIKKYMVFIALKHLINIFAPNTIIHPR